MVIAVVPSKMPRQNNTELGKKLLKKHGEKKSKEYYKEKEPGTGLLGNKLNS